MPRFLAPLLLLCLTFNAHADSYITRLLNKPVPGGVAVVDLGSAAQAPKATLSRQTGAGGQGTEQLAGDCRRAVDGQAGQRSRSAAAVAICHFTVGNKKYPEQRITLKNTQQVNPNPDEPQAHRG